MKKLLLSAAILSSFIVQGKNRTTKFSHLKNLNPDFIKELPLAGNNIPKTNATTHRDAPPSVTWTSINIGMAANSYTNAFSPKEPLWYDPNLNTLTSTHR